MKKFLLRSLFALVVLLAFNVFLIGLTYWVCSKTSFKLDDNKTVLVLGPSYLQAAIDPKYFPEAENVSASGTGKMFSYLKLKKFGKKEDMTRLFTHVMMLFGKSSLGLQVA